MRDEYEVRTPEAVVLSYSLAGIGSRFLAALIDFIIMVVLLFAVLLGALGLSLLGTNAAIIFFATASFVVVWGYYIFFEALWSGQTPGKRNLGIRVIKTSGLPIGFLESVVRNLVRVVDFLPSFYGLGVIVMFAGPRPRRLGDYAAGTVVVRERVPISLDALTSEIRHGSGDEPIAGEETWNVEVLSLDDDHAIRDFLQIAPNLRPEFIRDQKAAALGTQVAAKIGTSVGLDAETFLRRVVALRSGKTATAASKTRIRAPGEAGWDVGNLGPEHKQLIDEFLNRAPQLKTEARRRLAEQLCQAIAQRLAAPAPADPEAFLQRVAALKEADTETGTELP